MKTKKSTTHFNDYTREGVNTQEGIDQWYIDNDSTLQRLSAYLAAGFQKIQAADNWVALNGLRTSQTGMTAMVYDQDSTLYNALFILEPTYWVEQILGAKMQKTDQDEFRLGVFSWSEGQQQPNFIYQTDTFHIEKSSVRKELWILPETYLAIQPKGESYSDIIKSRSKNNLYFLVLSLFVVVIGSLLVIRNIKSTLKIAQLKSDFVSNVSHEIRTPLALIRMYAETLMLGRLSSEEKKKHYYQVIHHESGRLSYLVNNILDFSRIEANKKTYRLEDRELNEMAEIIHSNFSHYFEENKISCDLFLSPASIMISVDSQAFEEALSNLIENAIKYNKAHANIEVSTFTDGEFACCSVKDQGEGISKDAQKHIFDKFYRVEGALTQKTKGTGLGLSLVKHVMESHQGHVTVDSKHGQGSIFTLKFPLITS